MIKINYLRLFSTFIITVLLQPPLMAKTKYAAATDTQIASATFIKTNASGCISTEINITGKLSSDRKASSAMIDIFKRNDCKDKVLIDGVGKTKISAKNFSFNRHLSDVTLKTKIKIFDTVTRRKKPVSVKVKWKGIGKSIRSRPKVYAIEPGKFSRQSKKIERKKTHAEAYGVFVIQGKKNKFVRADDANLTLLTPVSLSNRTSRQPLSISINNDDPVEEEF